MGRKGHRPKRNPILEYRQLPMDDLHRRIEQCREKGDTRTAIDIAKECHRRQPGPESSALLGRLYLERGHRLVEKNLPAEALMVLNNALAFGQGSVELLRLMFECGVRSRQYETALSALKRLDDPAERLRASAYLADEAVACGESLDRLCEPAVREDVQRIRRAFAAFERGDDPAVADELKGIALTSPCAAWKWLLLGLAAYTRGDRDRARASWGQCGDAGRPGRLAAILRSGLLHDGPTSDLPPPLRARLLDRFANPRLSLLTQIKGLLADRELQKVLDGCARLLALVDVAEREPFARRLARAVCEEMGNDEDVARRFNRVFGPLAEDPQLYRAAALCFEKGNPEEAIDLWSYYLDDLNEVKTIPPHLRNRARALLLRRVGDLAERADACHGLAFSRMGPMRSDEALEWYRESLKCCDSDRVTHEHLMTAYLRRNQESMAEQHAHEILKQWPNDISALVFLGGRCVKRDAYRKALGFLHRARQAEPFDDRIRGEIFNCYVQSARRRLEQGNEDLARRDYEQAEAMHDPKRSKAEFYCAWAALEWRADRPERAQELLDKALACRDEPPVVYLSLTAELSRAEAPMAVQERFEKLLGEVLLEQPIPGIAARMAEYLLRLGDEKVDYAKRSLHDVMLLEYLSRAIGQSSFSEEQLLPVCDYLEVRERWEPLEVLARQGVEQFPENFHFPLFLGNAQRGLGYQHLPAETCILLKRAAEQARLHDRIDVAAEILVLLEGLPFRRGSGPASHLDLLDALARMLGMDGFGGDSRRRASPRKAAKQPEGPDPQGVFDWMSDPAEEET